MNYKAETKRLLKVLAEIEATAPIAFPVEGNSTRMDGQCQAKARQAILAYHRRRMGLEG